MVGAICVCSCYGTAAGAREGAGDGRLGGTRIGDTTPKTCMGNMFSKVSYLDTAKYC